MKSFQEMELYRPLEKRLAELDYTVPTPIQAQTIPAAVEGKDILGCAQTGTGKTAAFALPILDYLGHDAPRAASGRPLVLVLAPTRELAIQIGQSFHTYGKHVRFRQTLVYGGVGQSEQVRSLKKGAHVLIATPGRLIDLMDQGHVQLSDVEILVLDEADRMLDMGFMPAIKKIIAKLPDDRQSLFFSATMPPKIRQLADQLLFNPFEVNVTPKTKSVAKIDQSVRMMERSEKVERLVKVLRGDDVVRSIVFTRTKHGANALTRKLEKHQISAVAIHGNKSQSARQKALGAFRDNRISVLVATDVAARGIDIDDVTHVVNFDMPVDPESYVHRVGRTGRAGADGIAISFCTADEQDKLREIEKLIGQPLRVQNPGAKLSEPTGNAAASRKPSGRNGLRSNGSPATGGHRHKKRYAKGGWNKRRATAKA
ncbi:ATP-dependent RNA helicase RhlE [Stieleria maiorica]|uniref:ATP-dependent RNA helicase RhlE n=1 Tax=Stieleria maiorica TaxID=2795974 RepID=A0A5B9M727_9BACT|nr:DEAD/DEAH box helicase [Stieleria maiorica]QEF96961.1 ATP-dependent RNA helicase RhlE [Stieleria maiorica]